MYPRILTVLLSLLLSNLFTAHGRETLVTDPAMVKLSTTYTTEGWRLSTHTSIGSNDIGNYMRELIEADPDYAFVINGDGVNNDYRPWIQFEFAEPLVVETDRSLVIKLTRHNYVGNSFGFSTHPECLEILTSPDGEEWTSEGFANFPFKGLGTVEFSSRFVPSANGIKYMRLRGIRMTGTNMNIYMSLGGVNIVLVGDDEPADDLWADSYHLNSDYIKHFAPYSFIPSLGIVEPINHLTADYCDWDKVWRKTAKGYEWCSDLEYLKAADLVTPPHRQVDGTNDKEINDELSVTPFRQPTHTAEHTLYAMPGDIVVLTPYYEMWRTANVDPRLDYNDYSAYEVDFAHWYNYRTGGNSPYLDFLIDPVNIVKSDKYGYFASPMMNHETEKQNVVQISTPEEWNLYATAVRDPAADWTIAAELTADLDFEGKPFIPIGCKAYPYCGTFRGNNHTVSNLVLNVEYDPAGEGTGLFGTLGKGADISYLALDRSCSLKGVKYVGLVAHVANDAEIKLTGLTNAGIVSAVENAGGIIGCCEGANISVNMSLCSVAGTVKGTKVSGVLAGYLSKKSETTVTQCVSTATLDYPVSGRHFANGEGFGFTDCWSTEYSATDGKEKAINAMTVGADGRITAPAYSAEPFEPEELARLLGEGLWYWDEDLQCVRATPDPEPNVTLKNAWQAVRLAANIASGMMPGNTNVEVAADLDFAGMTMQPIGTAAHKYAGEFNGNRHVVSNLTIESTGNHVGLFGTVDEGASIHALILDATCRIKGNNQVGLVGCADHAGSKIPVKLERLVNLGTVEGNTNVGALLGCAMSSTLISMSYCVAAGTVTAKTESGVVSGWGSNTSESKYHHILSIADFTYANTTNAARSFVRGSGFDFNECWSTQLDATDNKEKGITLLAWADAAKTALTVGDDTEHAYTLPEFVKGVLGYDGWCYDTDLKILPYPTLIDEEPDGENAVQIYTVDDYRQYIADSEAAGVYRDVDLRADLDFEGTDPGFIGSKSHHFKATFRGHGHTLSNIKIDNSEDNTGLFRFVGDGAVISNFKLEGITLNGKKFVGLIGQINAQNTPITKGVLLEKVLMTGVEIMGTDNAGAFLGCSREARSDDGYTNPKEPAIAITIRNCGVEGYIKGTTTSGVFAGWTGKSGILPSNPIFENCYAIVTLDNIEKVDNYSGANTSVLNCYVNAKGFNDGRASWSSKFGNAGNINYPGLCAALGPVWNHDGARWTPCVGEGVKPWTGNDDYDPEANIVKIHDIESYNAFAARVNAGETDLHAVLMADLDCPGVEVTEIGTPSAPFRGEFDGGGHTVSNLTIERPGGTGVGMFGTITQGASIHDFVLDNASISGQAKVGTIGDVVNFPKKVKPLESVYIDRVLFRGQVKASAENAGGIVGCVTHDDVYHVGTHLTDCGVEGSVTGAKESGSLTGWAGSKTNAISTATNCYNAATLSGGRNGGGNNFFPGAAGQRKVTGCTDINGSTEASVTWNFGTAGDIDYGTLANRLGGTWHVDDSGHLSPLVKEEVKLPPMLPVALPKVQRFYGAVATFRCPVEGEKIGNLPPDPTAPAGAGNTDHIIAADFGQTFSAGHINDYKKTITEPVIAFRHLFRIKDAKAFADEFSATYEDNREYIERNLRIIEAPVGKDFQVRLDNPVAVSASSVSPLLYNPIYYKVPGSDRYDLVRSAFIEYRRPDEQGWQTVKYNEIGTGKWNFDFAKTFLSDGVRVVNGQTFFLGTADESEEKYYRMLTIKAPSQPTVYRVRIKAANNNGNAIEYENDYYKPLVIQEFEIHFVDRTQAHLLPDDNLEIIKTDDASKTSYAAPKPKNPQVHSKAWLKAKYGEPAATVDFDEYRWLGRPGDGVKTGVTAKPSDYIGNAVHDTKVEGTHMYKWPVEWSTSTYAFGYHDLHDYNMYLIADHSSVVPYRDAADKREAARNFDKEKGLYDIKFYETGGKEQGYFYYVNAAADPGVMCTLKTEQFCPGTKIHVSAWLAEFSENNEVANVAFNFIAITKSGERVLIHSFITGYVDRKDLGKWNHIYYQFIPDLSRVGNGADVDHYALELDNNCSNSHGADYAIDDINMFVVQPTARAKQLTPVCRQATQADVKITMDYDALLASLGYQQGSGDFNLYYTFIDKEKYHNALAGGTDPDVAFGAAQLRYDYANDGNVTGYGKLTVPLDYYNLRAPDRIAANKYRYPDYNTVYQELWAEDRTDATLDMVFKTRPDNSGQLRPGDEYLIALTDVDPSHAGSEHAAFDPEAQCAHYGIFRVEGASTFRVDGLTLADGENAEYCVGQMPRIEASVWAETEDSDQPQEVKEAKAIFDWFDGTAEEYEDYAAGTGDGKMYLSDVLAAFRHEWPLAKSVADTKPKGELTGAMHAWLTDLTAVKESSANPVLTLYRKSYIFAPLHKGLNYVTAIPVESANLIDDMLLCTAPTEITVRGTDYAPDMTHGLPHLDSEYPEPMKDVPLRIGLRQLKAVNTTTDATPGVLTIPLRRVECPGANATQLEVADDRNVYLVDSDDPEYDERVAEVDPETVAGLITAITALESPTPEGGATVMDNSFSLTTDPAFNFKEGFTYRFRFAMRQGPSDPSPADPGHPCDGQHLFTIKVVPEYMAWNPAEGNLNWNNDLNWRRVPDTDLYLPEVSELREHHTVTGSNGNETEVFAPLHFTKVIIDPQPEYPELGEVNDVKAGDRDWSDLRNAVSVGGDPTEEIHFDMEAYGREAKPAVTGKDVECRPWQANNCDEIHFRPDTELLGQQWLRYNKAWVDLEVKAGAWHILGSPLQGVVAGDMYLPTANARQVTELFQPISFDNTLQVHNRFAPAVYQRSWSKSAATVYEVDGTSRNVAVRADWSKVYNDVDEHYRAGEGFSVKALTEGVTAPDSEGYVMFRLPKDDGSYRYFTSEGTLGSKPDAEISRTGAGRLNPTSGSVTVTAAHPTRHFLVGNPFMAHMDLRAFVAANSDVITGKYWTADANRTEAVMLDTDDDVTVHMLPPMGAVFVEAKEKTDNLTLTYDATMTLRHTPGARARWLETWHAAPAAPGPSHIRVSAYTDGHLTGSALLRMGAGYGPGYDDAEDALVIYDGTSAVYSVAAGKAVAVNSLPCADATEVGLLGTEGQETVLVFDGEGCNDGVTLFDASTGITTPLHNGYRLTVRGDVSGRLFLNGGVAQEAISGLDIKLCGRKVTVTSTYPGATQIQATVYTPAGMIESRHEGEAPAIEFTLTEGVHMVEATDGACVKRLKAICR